MPFCRNSLSTNCGKTEANMEDKRKLRVLVITTDGSERQKRIMELFSQPEMAAHFDPPEFSPSVPSRSLRNRYEFFRIANEAGLLPSCEWQAIKEAQESKRYETSPEKFLDCLKHLPVTQGRRGSKSDLKLHYSCEFWYKAKTINRGRSVLGCSLAHLIALKRFTSEEFDVMLEDNVRAPVESCAQRIWEAMEASHRQASEEGVECHFRFIGWLGSRTNLEYLLQTQMPKRCFPRPEDHSCNPESCRVSPFPLLEHVDLDLPPPEEPVDTKLEEQTETANQEEDKCSGSRHSRPGGNFVWGSYAYWISEKAYQCLLETLRNDVGAMLWKGKRARFYSVKPIDKMLPRQIISSCGAQSVQLATRPAFFRAPMLTSKIHIKWDPEFCKSTEYQLEMTGLAWSDLWLSSQERQAVEHRLATGAWVPPEQGKHDSGECTET